MSAGLGEIGDGRLELDARPTRRRSVRMPIPDLQSAISYLSPPISRTVIVLAFLLTTTLFLTSCSYYSFTGATIPPHLQTISIPLVQNVSTSPLTNLEDDLTGLLVDRFVGQTRLSLEPSEAQGDAILTAEIQRYINEPTAVGGGEQATLNRITISVLVTYFDRVNGQEIFNRTFTGTNEYDPQSAAGLAGEEDAAAAALENIADDVFSAATSNW